jgi:phage tail-like protein
MSKRTVGFVVLGLLGLVALGVVGVLVADDDRTTGAFSTTSTMTDWKLELDGVQVGGLQAVTGCRPKGEVVSMKQTTQAGNPEIVKQLSTVRIVPCVLQMGLSNQQVVYQWINGMLTGQAQPKDLVLTQINRNTGRAALLIDVSNALVTSVRIPTFDAVSAETFSLELTVDAEEIVRTDYGSSGPITSGTQAPRAPLLREFSFELVGVQASQNISKVEGFTAKRQLIETLGEQRIATVSLGELVVGDTEITTTPNFAAQFNSWFHSFVIQGQNNESDEKTAMLNVLSGTDPTPLLTFQLDGVGIFDALTTGTTEAPRRTYSLYLEGVRLVLPSASNPPAPTPPPSPPTSPPPPPPPTTTPPPPPPPATTTTETTKTEPSALAPPKEVRASLASDSEVELGWETSADEVEGYVVLYSTKSGGPYTEILRTEESKAFVGKLEGGPPYYFVVRAFRGEAESEDSPEAEATG